jgi:uncharacterized membrane protein YphA (DoxX/SURF4 family)
MKHLPTVAGILLGLMFAASGIIGLLNLVPNPELPEGSAAAHFMAAFGPTGYMNFVKVLEVLGGILVAVPRTRNIGLLVLGPILVNILAYHTFVTQGEDLLNPGLIVMCLLAVYLMWSDRKAWRGLIR